MQPSHSGDILHHLFARRVPYDVLPAERHADEHHGLPGISKHKIWQPKDGFYYTYFIVRSRRISKTKCRFFRNPRAPSFVGECQPKSRIGLR
jgi:hypothetical protein